MGADAGSAPPLPDHPPLAGERAPDMKLRTQILLISLVLLALPVAGWYLVRGMETALRDDQARILTGNTAAAAETLAGAAWPAPEGGLYVHITGQPFTVDGYADDWQQWMDQAQSWRSDAPGAEATVRFLAARNDQGLHLFFDVDDLDPVFATMGPDGVVRGDHVQLAVRDDTGHRELTITPFAPGSVEASADDLRVRGEWQSRAGGWTLELQLRTRNTPQRLGFSIVNGGTGGIGPSQPLPLTTALSELHARLAALTPAGLRAWIVDPRGIVLARVDRRPATVDPEHEIGWLATFFYERLASGDLRDHDLRDAETPRLRGPEISAALAGTAGFHWHTLADRPGVAVSAGAPIEQDGEVVGAVVFEQTGDATLLITNRALLRLFGLTLVIFGVAVLVLLIFATLLTVRIRRLRDAAESAVTSDGRVLGMFKSGDARDEMGDLRHSVAALLDRLREQQDYLRTLADKLTHELRTPLATIRTSLENLNHAGSFEEAGKYRARAKEGMNRLSRILNAMGQASRLEQSLREDTPEPVDLARLLGDYVASCRELHPDRSFGLEIRDRPKPISGSPELIAQLLDKLTENAVDFSPEDGAIHFRLHSDREGAVLEVENEGPPLPEAMRGQLFESMVSVRERRGEGVHLGLGLYVARLIAEHHGGGISARDVDGGVVVTVNFR